MVPLYRPLLGVWFSNGYTRGLVILGGIKSIAWSHPSGSYNVRCILVSLPLHSLLIFLKFRSFSFNYSSGLFSRCRLWRLLGVLIIGVKRAVFSNEAGIGSAAIAHGNQVQNPIEEGVVALLEPFIDTIVVCTMTALFIIITGAYLDPSNAEFIANNQGGALTSAAMAGVIPWFPYILAIAVFLFAFSTMISWSYYGERCWVYLFGDRSSLLSNAIPCIYLSWIHYNGYKHIGFSDLMILGMAFPNIRLLILSGSIRKDLNHYQKHSNPKLID